VFAEIEAAQLMDKSDPQRVALFGKAAVKGNPVFFFQDLFEQMTDFTENKANTAVVVFAMGRALKGHIDETKREMFGRSVKFNSRIDHASEAVDFYDFQLQSYRKGVDIWTVIGLRNNVCKDIRRLIGDLIWDARDEAKYIAKKKE
jgi:hypothetical protein